MKLTSVLLKEFFSVLPSIVQLLIFFFQYACMTYDIILHETETWIHKKILIVFME